MYQEELINGIRTIVHTRTELPLVCAGIMFHVGSANEDEGEEGYAHFLEHLVFKGAVGSKPREFNRKADNLSVSLNAQTDKTDTFFYFSGLKEVAPEMFRMFCETLQNPALRQQEIDVEKGVILEEFDHRDNHNGIICFENMVSMAYQNHPLGKGTLGTRENIMATTAEKIRAFHDKHYGKENMTVIFVGDVTVEEIRPLVTACCEGFPSVSVQPLSPLAPVEENKAHIERNVAAWEVNYGTRTDEPLPIEEYAVWEILGQYLSNGGSAPLFSRLREERGLVYAAGAFASTTDHSSGFIFSWTGAGKNTDEILAICLEELRKVADGIVDEERFLAVKRKKLVTIMRSRQTNDSIMRAIQAEIDRYGKTIDPEYREGIYKNIAQKDIQNAAKHILDMPFVMATLGATAN